MDSELQTLSNALNDSLRRVIEAVEGLSADELNWRPPAPESNSVGVLATHVMGNIRQNALAVACGLPDERDRPGEFAAQVDSADALVERARDLQRRLAERLAELAPGDLDTERRHPARGGISAREALLIPIRHAAEHIGHLDLTRDLMKASRSAE